MPFGKLGYGSFLENGQDNFVSRCGGMDNGLFEGYEPDENDLLLLTHQFMSAFAQTEKKQLRNINDTENLLKVALFVANRALLTLLSPEVKYSSSGVTGRKIYTSPGVTVQRPVLSKAALIILSVLLGLQLLGLGYLTYYLYRFPTWSDQLDAMAMARIGASLDHRGVLPAIGPVSKKDLDSLQTVEGLIGIVEKEPYRESSQTRLVSSDLHAAGGSDVELQQLTSTEEAQKSPEVRSPDVELGLGASGAILSTNVPRRSPYVRGMKKAWGATFITRVPSPAEEDERRAETQDFLDITESRST
jgi:hypothetical protein